MPGDVVISSFSPADKTPGFYGQVQYGVNGQSSGTNLIVCLLVGLMSSAGNLTPDTEVRQVFEPSDIDAAAGIGSELACMGYDALAAQPSVPIFLASAALPGGAVQATATILFSGTITGAGTVGVSIDGYQVTVNPQTTDTPSTVATALASAINGANGGRLPIVATASSGTVVLKCVTANARGNQHVVFLVTTENGVSVLPAGLAATITGNPWVTLTPYTTTQYVVPTAANGFYYKCTVGGTSGGSQPTWPTTVGTTVTDGTVTWTCWGTIVTGGGVFLGGGTGLETYTNLINTLSTAGYGRIALAANDSTSISAWKTKVDGDAGALTGFLEHVVLASNDTQANVTTIAQTNCNDQRFEVLALLNCQTHPSRMAAVFAVDRAFEEVIDPNKNYDFYPLPSIVPQSQKADLWLHSQKMALLNVGATPLDTVGGQVQVVRAITTKCLTNSQPDYSTLDVGDAVVPDFVLYWMKGLWTTFQKNNPRVRGNLATGEKKPRSGVAYPDLWSSKVASNLALMAAGDVPGQCPPILDPKATVANPPVTDLDPAEVGRLMTACPVFPIANTHQLGLVVQQSLPPIAA